MKKDIKSIIEEQRELAAELHELESEETRIQPLAYLVVEYFDLQQDRMEKLQAVNAQSVPELAAALRQTIEEEIVQSAQLSKGDLILGFAFYALHDVDWEEAAVHMGDRLRRRAEAMDMFKRTGYLTLLHADDDLPKN